MAELVGQHNYRGFFGDAYAVHVRAHAGTDYSRTCFVFPGQGSAYPGMGKDLFANPQQWRHLLQPADELCTRLGYATISQYFDSPTAISKLQLPLVQNIALFVVEVAYGQVLQQLGIQPVAITAHSFGEYAAFVCASMVDYRDMLEVVAQRDLVCPPPGELGRLIAIEGNVDDVAKIMRDISYSVSNVNSPTQTVVAVAAADLPNARGHVAASNRRFKELTHVAQPYHSVLLGPAQQKFAAFLRGQQLRITAPKIPLVSSVTTKTVLAEDFDPKNALDILSNQLTTPVLFGDQILTLHAEHHCFNFIEVGPKAITIDLVRQILGEKKCRVRSAESIIESRSGYALGRHERDLALRQSKFFGLVLDVVGRVTGYDVTGISVEDRFQEQLGIDSIKKAEIVVRLLKEANLTSTDAVDLAGIRSVGAAIRMLEESQPSSTRTLSHGASSSFVAYEENWQPLGANKHPLASEPAESTEVHFVHVEFKEMLEGKSFTVLSHQTTYSPVWVIQCPTAPEPETTDNACQQLLAQSLNLMRSLRSLARILAGGRSIRLVLASTVDCLWVEALAAALKSVSKEFGSLALWEIQFDQDIPSREALQQLITVELGSPQFETIRYIEGERHVRRLLPTSKQTSAGFAPDSVVVAMGGARGITAELLLALPDRRNIDLVVLGRTARSDEEIGTALKRFKAQFHSVEYEEFDVRDYTALLMQLDTVARQHGKIDLLVVGAGVEHSRSLVDKPDEEIEAELATKLVPMLVAKSLKGRIKRVSFLSSIVAVYGNAGQSAYAFANAMLGRACEHKGKIAPDAGADRKGSTWQAIHWPPWDNVGMTAVLGMSMRLQQFGLSLIDRQQAAEFFCSHGLNSRGAAVVLPMAEHDSFFYCLGLGRHDLVGHSLGEPIGGELCFERTVSSELIPTLKDHAIDNRVFFPAAYFVEMMLAAAVLGGRAKGSLRGVRVLAPLVIEGVHYLTTRIRRVEGAVQLSVETNLQHMVAQLTDRAPEFTRPSPVQADVQIGVELYGPVGLFHGPTLQLLPGLTLNAQGDSASVDLDLRSEPWTQLPAHKRVTHVIDAAYQLFSALGSFRVGFLAIPVSMDNLHFDLGESIGEHLTIIGRLRRTDANGFVGDCWVIDLSGRNILELRGLEHRFYEDERGRRDVEKRAQIVG